MGIYLPNSIGAYSKHQIWARTIFSNSNIENCALVVTKLNDIYRGHDCIDENI